MSEVRPHQIGDRIRVREPQLHLYVKLGVVPGDEGVITALSPVLDPFDFYVTLDRGGATVAFSRLDIERIT